MECSKTYIYTLSHPLTGEVRYVGKTRNVQMRFYGHTNDYGVSRKSVWISELRAAGLKPIMEQVDVVDSNIPFWEQHYISLFKSWGFDLVNFAGHSAETKEKLSRANKIAFANPEVREAISKRLTGRKLSDETKQKLSKLNSGENNPFFGKPLTDSHKENLSKALKGKKHQRRAQWSV